MYGLYTNLVSNSPDRFSSPDEQGNLAEALKKSNQVRLANRVAGEDAANRIFREDMESGASPRNNPYPESTYWAFPGALDVRETRLNGANQTVPPETWKEVKRRYGIYGEPFSQENPRVQLGDEALTNIISQVRALSELRKNGQERKWMRGNSDTWSAVEDILKYLESNNEL